MFQTEKLQDYYGAAALHGVEPFQGERLTCILYPRGEGVAAVGEAYSDESELDGTALVPEAMPGAPTTESDGTAPSALRSSPPTAPPEEPGFHYGYPLCDVEPGNRENITGQS